MKIQLISPRPEIGGNYAEGVYWPTGLLSIGNYIKKFYSDLKVELLDGNLVKPQSRLEKVIDGEIVGITANSMNYGNVLRTAKAAKESGATVIIGGPHASTVGELIIANRPFIDLVVKYDGERAVLLYLQGKPLEKIPNLIYRQNGEIKTNQTSIENIALYSELDFGLLNLETYFENHKRLFPDLPARTIVFFTHLGCGWRSKSGGCSFCSIPHSYKKLEPKEIWRKLEILKERYNLGGFKDYGDDLLSDKKWVKELVETRPKNMENLVIAGVYASPRYLTKEMADHLKRLNVELVYLGFESGNNQILKRMNKGCTVEQNLRSAKRLSERGVRILASYVLGFEGESEKSLSDTFELAKKIADLKTTRLSQAGIIVTLPGSKIYKKLVEKFPGVGKTDLFDIQETRKKWVEHFCDFNTDSESAYQLLEEVSYKITDLSELKDYVAVEAKK